MTLIASACSSSSDGNNGGPSTAGGPHGEIAYFDLSGGSASKALADGLWKNFTNETGVPVTIDFGGTIAKLQAAVQAGQVPWSLAQTPFLPAVDQAKLLQKIDTSIVPVDQLQPGTYDEYSIQYGTYGMNLTWSLKNYPASGPQPSSMADLYDTQKFPGKRCFMSDVRVGWVLESALIADGVAPNQLYPIDMDRAIKKLGTIKNDIVWNASPTLEVQNFENGSCAIGIIANGMAKTMIVADKYPASFTWNQAGWASSSFGIPKGAPNANAAQYLLKWIITDTKGQAVYSEAAASPVPTGLKHFDPSSITDQTLLRFLPAGDNMKDTTPRNNQWWTDNQVMVNNTINKFKAS
ncbi:extracellular solute-binding protein [Dactylosporangium salmoneum]|uniref:ABC transporter substrate-binding protein n=1 Tax=Dactylosporangium salmoneum TaxID=53361 RepID=A0ABP5UY84_9ACTN